ncbi:MAG: c-type cytochrome [Burkholderiales bacterium]|nr:c-type cytochrome [Burkholderiales bacterium]
MKASRLILANCFALLLQTAQAAEPVAPATIFTAKAQLGRMIFFDASLSEPAGQACATCHAPERAFSDPDQRAPTSKGVLAGRMGKRNTPSILYARFSPAFHFEPKEKHYEGGQFWDGRAATLEVQAKGPMLNPLEMANPDPQTVVKKIRTASYAPLFETVFGKGALDQTDQAYMHIAEALAEFQRDRTFTPFSSKYDRYLAGQLKLSAQELRGLRLYENEKKGNCAACHPNQPSTTGAPPLFTDFTYDNLGVPRNPANPFYRLAKAHNPEGEKFIDRGLGGALNKRREDGKFKVPTLRNIALTAPYMHNGYFRTLEGVMAFYNNRDRRPLCKQPWVAEDEAMKRKCWPAPEVTRNVNRDELGRLGLTQRETDDIIAFMKTLTDGYAVEQTAESLQVK